MDLVSFLEANWFPISGLITLIGFVIKTSKNIQKQTDAFETRTNNLEKAYKDLSDKHKTETAQLHEEMRAQNEEFHKEIIKVTSEIKQDISRQNEELVRKMDESDREIKLRLDSSESKRIEGAERTRILLDGVEATLVSLHNEGHNGPVTKSLEEIRDYKSAKAARD